MTSSLESLQAELAATFASQPGARITHSSAVEIMSKLEASGLIEVMHTTDGKAYVTPAAAEQEAAAVVARDGRVEVASLAHELGLDYGQMERVVRRVAKARGSEMVVVDTEVLAQGYVDQVVQEGMDVLVAQGSLSPAALAARVNLPLSFVRSAIEAHAGRGPHAAAGHIQVMGSMLHTSVHVQRVLARARAAARAALSPIRLADLVKASQSSSQSAAVESLLRSEADGLGGALVGSGSSALWVPDVYVSARTDWVDAYFRDNGLIPNAVLAAAGFSAPEAFASSHWGPESGTALPSMFVSTRYLETLDAMLADALGDPDTGFVVLAAELHPAFAEEDTAAVLALLPSLRGPGVVAVPEVAAPVVVLSPEFVGCVTQALVSVAEAAVSDGEYERERARAVARARVGAGAQAPRRRPAATLALSRPRVAELLCHTRGSLHSEPDALDALTAHFVAASGPIVAGAIDASIAAADAEAAPPPSPLDPVNDVVADVLSDLDLYVRGGPLLRAAAANHPSSAKLPAALDRAALRAKALALVDVVLLGLARAEGIVPPQRIASSGARKELIASLTDDLAAPCRSLVACASSGPLATFVDALRATLPTLGLADVPTLDDDAAAALLAKHAEFALGAMVSCADPAAGLQLALVRVFAAHHGILVHVPGKHVGSMVMLYAHLAHGEEQMDTARHLSAFYDVTYDWLIGKRASPDLCASALAAMAALARVLDPTVDGDGGVADGASSAGAGA